MKTYIGIDPGKTGAVAFLRKGRAKVFPMPMTGEGKIGEINSRGLWILLRHNIKGDAFVVLEKAFIMSLQKGQHTIGVGYGEIRAVLKCMRISFIEVVPIDWKKDVLRGLPWKQIKKKTKRRKKGEKKIELTKEEQKEINKEKTAEKKRSKQVAIQYIMKKYPKLNLKRTLACDVPCDGICEALCMAEYARIKDA